MSNDSNRTAVQIFNEMAETMQKCHPENIDMEEARMLTRDFIAFCNLCVRIQVRMEKEQAVSRQKPTEQKLSGEKIITN